MDGDLISQSALLKILEEEHDGTRRIYFSLIDYRDKEVCKGELGTYARIKRIVEEAPAVDAVEVVRCKNCKHGIDSASNPLKRWCNQHATNVQNNDFCSYGERREDNG